MGMEATCDAWGMRGATYYGAHGLKQRMPLHPHFILASVQCLVCSLCKNSLVASLQIDTERLSWTSAADTVKDGASVEIEVAMAVRPAGRMGVFGRVPFGSRGDARGSPGKASGQRCARARLPGRYRAQLATVRDVTQ